MIKKFVPSLIGLSFTMTSWSMTCELTLAKDSCWTKYNVTVNILDPEAQKNLGSIAIPAGQQWSKTRFTCNPGEKLIFSAGFSPQFWENDPDRTYMAAHYWSLPEKINTDETAWTMSLCYPQDFSLVPYPPDAKGNCACDFSKIPATVPPVKK